MHSVVPAVPRPAGARRHRRAASGLVLVSPPRGASARPAAGAVPALRLQRPARLGLGARASRWCWCPVPEPWRLGRGEPAAGARRALCARGDSPSCLAQAGGVAGPVARGAGFVVGHVPVAVRRRRAHAARARRHLARFPASAVDAGHRRIRSMIEVILREDVKSLGQGRRDGPGEARLRAQLSPAPRSGLRGHRGQQEADRARRPGRAATRDQAERAEAERFAAELGAVTADADGQGRRGGQAVRLDHRPGHRRRPARRRGTRWTAGGSSWSTRSRRSGTTPWRCGCIPRSTPRSASRSSRSSPTPMTVGIAYVDGPRLARSLFAAADWVAAGRDEINRINVFPVPDGDTGTNFSLTLRAVADALRALGDAPLPETARTMARAAVLGARGNSGMMLAHFLMGFAESLGERPTRRPATSPRRCAAAPTGCTSRSTIPARAPSSRSPARPRRPPNGRPPTPRTSASSCAAARGGRGRARPDARADGRAQGGGRGRRRRQGLRPDARRRGPLHRGRPHPAGGAPTPRARRA